MVKMTGSFKLAFLMMVCVLFITTSASSPRQQRTDESNTSDALKYLQALDSYYSNIARPRLIRSESAQKSPDLETAVHLLRLQTIDRIYSSQNRPRFGKRAGFYKMMRDRLLDDTDTNDWQNNLFSRK